MLTQERKTECVFCSTAFLFAFLCIRVTPNSLRECHCAGIFTFTLLLRTTCSRFQLSRRISGVAILVVTNKQTNKEEEGVGMARNVRS